MATFHFNLHEDGVETPGNEGCEFVDLAAARRMAIESARGIMAADLLGGRLCLSSYIDVLDVAGTRLVTVPFYEAVAVSGG